MEQNKEIKLLNLYYLVDKKTGKVTLGPLSTRQDCRLLKQPNEHILQTQPVAVKFVR